ARCTIYQSRGEEEKESITDGWTGEQAAVFKLVPGPYELVVEDREDIGNPKVSFPGIVIEAGKTVEKLAEFSGGTLKVKAVRNGKPISARCYVVQTDEEGEKKPVTDGSTSEDAAVFKLVPGVYGVIVEDANSREQKEFKAVAIEAAKAQNLEARF
ncbi:MAG TPA: hypothetical protein VEF34_15885, partial [Syntrophobacteraceae bacterium]|nr:hypothetical protein [Syntrophobacteraceae bacterium]